MKNYVVCMVMLMAAVVSSCSSSASDGNTQEGKMVKMVKKQLKKKGKLTDYQIVTGQIPVEMMADEFKSYRDAVFKAHLDYGACQVRGLKAGMEKATATIAACQDGIKEKAGELRKAQADTEHVFVLATVKGKQNNTLNFVAVFNPDTQEMETLETITTPIRNNAILLTNVMNGSLLDYGMNANQDLDSLANTVSNPIVKFILKSTPV